jgi:hypothetical protein
MRIRQLVANRAAIAIGSCAVTIALIGTVNIAAAATHHTTIKACANKKTGALRVAKSCHHNEKRVTWAAQGARGAKGAKGDRGPAGPITGVAPSGVTQRGGFAISDNTVAGTELETFVTFPLTLTAPPTVVVVNGTAPSGSPCSGSDEDPGAAAGYACFFIDGAHNISENSGGVILIVQNIDSLNDAANTFGAALGAIDESGGAASIRGSWAVTAP